MPEPWYHDSGTAATLNPTADLAAGATYTATISTDPQTDAAGNHIGSHPGHGRSLLLEQHQPHPTVLSTIPTNGATGVSASANVQATFSEAMNPSSVTASTFTLVQTSSGAPVPAAVTMSSWQYSCNPEPHRRL